MVAFQNLAVRFLGLLLLFAFLADVTSAAQPPNVVIILVDDLGYGDLSAYGAADLQSPHIDRLIQSGMRFDNFYANCPVCSPTRASILTGRYPELVGVPGVIRTHAEDSWGYLAPDAVLLPAILKSLGYHSAIVGKWHLGLSSPNTPNQRGFDLFRGYLGDMMDDYYKHRRYDINYMRFNEDEVDPAGHATDLFTDWACEYVRERKASQQPFFLYLAYNAPHTPIQPPDDWLAKVKKREPGITDKRAKLVALIEHLDAGIGNFVDTLKETGQDKSTLVFFTSDNGGQLDVGANNGATRNGKQSMYEGGLRVPACAVWPGTIPTQSRTETIAMSMDLLPTICEAVGLKLEHGVDGVSLWPTLLGEQQQLHRDHFFHRREGGNQYQGLTINAIRRGDWKLLQNSPFSPLELYDLASDPLESTNLASKNRAKFDELSKVLRVQVQRGGSVPWQAPTSDYRGTETLAR